MLSAADQLNHLREVAITGGLPQPRRPSWSLRCPPRNLRRRREGRARRISARERKELRAALKAVQLDPGDAGTTLALPEDMPASAPEPAPRGACAGRLRTEPAPELTEVAISEPEPVAGPRRREPPAAQGMPSYFPTPTYIPQAEYAQMLRDQKAAEKAAAEAAAELRRLADLEEIDELAKKEEFSDWTS